MLQASLPGIHKPADTDDGILSGVLSPSPSAIQPNICTNSPGSRRAFRVVLHPAPASISS